MSRIKSAIAAALATAVALYALCAYASTFYVTVSQYAVNADVVTWANSTNGHPSVGLQVTGGAFTTVPGNWPALIKAGGHVVGVTETVGPSGHAIQVRAPWRSIKPGLANTIGTIPISHQATRDCFANMASGLVWFQNYGPRPWCWVSYNTPLTNSQSLVFPFNDIGPESDVTTSPCNSPSCLSIPAGVQFVPSFMDVSHMNATELSYAQPYAAKSGWIITNNEPYGEGNNTVAQVIAAWPALQAMADAANAKIIAPSIGYSVGTSVQDTWLSDFLTQIASHGLRVDALNYHGAIGDYTDSAGVDGQIQTAFAQLDAMHATYPTYQIWITEMIFYANTLSYQAQLRDSFMAGIEGRGWIDRMGEWVVGTDPGKPGGQGFDQLSKCDASSVVLSAGTDFLKRHFKSP